MRNRKIAIPGFILILFAAAAAIAVVTDSQTTSRVAPENANEARLNREQPPEQVMDIIGAAPGMTIAEIGAGQGRYVVNLANRVGPAGKIYAEDIDEEALRHCAERCRRNGFDNVETVLGGLTDPRLPENSLDLIFVISSYHHFDDPVALMKNALPALKPTGRLAIAEWVRLPGQRGEGTAPDTMKAQMDKAGFILERTDKTFENNRLYIYLFRLPTHAYLGQKPPGTTPEIFAPGLLSTGSHELDLTMTPDGKEIFFTRSGPDWFSAILQFKLEKDAWVGPLMPAFSGTYQNSYPFASPDGTKIFFNSTQPAQIDENTKGDGFVYISEKRGDDWSRGKPISKNVVSNHTESFFSVAANGNLYFGARYKEGLGGCDIYMRRYGGGVYQKAENLGNAVNSENDEFHCFISPDEEYLIFDARRPDGLGENDLYISFKSKSGTWGKAVNMGGKINSKWSDSRPYVSPDGKYLFFSSNRVRDDKIDEVSTIEEFQQRIEGPLNGFQDMYWVSAGIIDELRPKKAE